MGRLLVAGIVFAMAGGLYCCIISGAREDRRMEKMMRDREENGKDGDG